MDSDATGQPLLIYCAFVKYLRENGNTMKQCIKKAYDSVRRKAFYNIPMTFDILTKIGKANKIVPE